MPSPFTPASIPGELALLSRQVLTANATTIDAPGLAQNFTHLIILAGVRTDQASVLSNCLLTFNGDGGANYYRQFDRGAVAAASAGQNLAATSFSLDGTGATADAAELGIVQLWVPYYASTNRKVAQGSTGLLGDVAGASARETLTYLKWNSTAAITRVTVSFGGGTTLTAPSFLDVFAYA